MKYWIKKISMFLGLSVFFIVLFNGISYEDPFELSTLLPTLAIAVLGAVLFWIAGIIIADIVLKGIIEDIPDENLDLLDGGIIQRMKQYGNKDKFHSIADDVKNELPKKDEKKKD